MMLSLKTDVNDNNNKQQKVGIFFLPDTLPTVPLLLRHNFLATAWAPRVRYLACNIIPDSAGICYGMVPGSVLI